MPVHADLTDSGVYGAVEHEVNVVGDAGSEIGDGVLNLAGGGSSSPSHQPPHSHLHAQGSCQPHHRLQGAPHTTHTPYKLWAWARQGRERETGVCHN